MSPEILPAIILGVGFLALLITGLPIAFCLLSTSIICLLIFDSATSLISPVSMILDVTSKDIYLAIPMFILMAMILQFSGLVANLYEMMYKWSGRMRGGLAIGSIFISTILAATTGLAATGVVTVGPVALPEMLKRGYDKRLAIGCIPAGGVLGPIIPPSVLMVMIGGLTGVSVGALFMGGLVPGLILALLFIIYIIIRCMIDSNLAPAVSDHVSWREKLVSLRLVILPLLLIIAVLGSIYSGMATPTEAASAGAFGAIICSAINRTLSFKSLKKAVIGTIPVAVMVYWLLIAGTFFSVAVSKLGGKEIISDMLLGVGQVNPIITIVLMMAVVFILGLFIDGTAITIICLPLFAPLAVQLGYNLFWFDVMFAMGIICGYLSPPFGFCLFYTKGIAPPSITMKDIYAASWPYVAIICLVWGLVAVFPAIATWAPSMMK